MPPPVKRESRRREGDRKRNPAAHARFRSEYRPTSVRPNMRFGRVILPTLAFLPFSVELLLKFLAVTTDLA